MKDPAVLFYTQDFITGTILMSDEQRGKYILLLCLQHQNGSLTEAHMLKICGGYDEDVFSKFDRGTDGRYYNKRMMSESEKRQKFTDSRRNNLKGKKDTHMNSHMEQHMDVHMENENENENINEKVDKYKTMFDEFRIKYPSNKKGLETEFANMRKKHKDYKDVIPILLPSLELQIEHRKRLKDAGSFVPQWKHLTTWINNRCWEEEMPEEAKAMTTTTWKVLTPQDKIR